MASLHIQPTDPTTQKSITNLYDKYLKETPNDIQNSYLKGTDQAKGLLNVGQNFDTGLGGNYMSGALNNKADKIYGSGMEDVKRQASLQAPLTQADRYNTLMNIFKLQSGQQIQILQAQFQAQQANAQARANIIGGFLGFGGGALGAIGRSGPPGPNPSTSSYQGIGGNFVDTNAGSMNSVLN